jgi:HTH-type transcriptional regulator/antitoxin HipB
MTSSTTQPLLTSTQLGQLLRAARKRRGLTQAEVGARLGLSQNRVSHLEGHAD